MCVRYEVIASQSGVTDLERGQRSLGKWKHG